MVNGDAALAHVGKTESILIVICPAMLTGPWRRRLSCCHAFAALVNCKHICVHVRMRCRPRQVDAWTYVDVASGQFMSSSPVWGR
jgi:hypothetical protein